MTKIKSLGVNIDHIATLRQARATVYPDPFYAAKIAEENGADSITMHLREDRRHIQKQDVLNVFKGMETKLNLEMAVTTEMVDFALELKPQDVCLVPEKREELTTEGGLDVVKHFTDVKKAVEQMSAAGIIVSLFIDADKKQIEASKEIGAPVIEIHTGHYADAANLTEQTHEFEKIKNMAIYAHSLGLQVNAGHGLHYHNTLAIAMLPEVVELNIGHAIMARAFFTGLGQAVKDMKQILLSAR
jgi:pyridoxine 5-phosphate synthase